MTLYVIPMSEVEIQLKEELAVLGTYGHDRYLLAQLATEAICIGISVMENIADDVFEVVRECAEHSGVGTNDANLEADAAMAGAEFMIIRASEKLEDYFAPYVNDITLREGQYVDITVKRALGDSIVLETHHLDC